MLKKIIVILFIVIIVALVVCWTVKETIVSRVASGVVHRPVSVEQINLGFKSVSVDGFEIGGDADAQLDKALSVGSINVQAAPSTFLDDPMVIEEIVISDVYMGLEMYNVSGSDNNWTRMLNEMTSEMEEAEQAPEDAAQSKNVIIKRILITNLEVEAIFHALNGKTIKPPVFDQIELTDIGTDEPVPYDQVMMLVMRKIMTTVGSAGDFKGILNDLSNPADLLQKIDPSEGGDFIEKGKDLFKKIF